MEPGNPPQAAIRFTCFGFPEGGEGVSPSCNFSHPGGLTRVATPCSKNFCRRASRGWKSRRRNQRPSPAPRARFVIICEGKHRPSARDPARLRSSQEAHMANPGQPTISTGASGDAVKRWERALRRTPDEGLRVDGNFGPHLEAAVKSFQQGAGLTADGIVGPLTWAALPECGPMPTLQVGSTGPVVSSRQMLLTNGAPGATGDDARRARRSVRPAYASVRSKRFRPGAAWLRTASSATRPGPNRCTRPAPRSKRRSVCNSWGVKRESEPHLPAGEILHDLLRAAADGS